MSKLLFRHAGQSIRQALGSAAIALLALPLAAVPMSASGQSNNFDLLADDQLEIFQSNLAHYHFGNSLLDDPVSELYIRRLLARLNPPERIAVFILDDSSINALAVWGNMIFIHTGLIEFIDGENELFAVMAHEVGHIVQEHFARMPKQLQGVSSIAAAALILGILNSDAEISDAMIAGAQGSLQAAAYEQTRIYEYEADSIALDLLGRAETGSDGMVSILRKLKSTPGVPEYMLSHPISDNRVAAVQAYARQLPKFEAPAESRDFGFIKARIRQRSHIANLSEKISDEPQDIRDYLQLLDKKEGSSEAARRLQKNHPRNWIVAHALADFYISENRAAEAEQVLSDALKNDPENHALIALRLDALAKSNNRQQAILALGKLSSMSYTSPLIAKAEAQFWAGEKNDYNYRIALARYSYSRGDMDGARQQLKFAQEAAEKNGHSEDQPQVIRIREKIDSIEKALGIEKN